MYIYIYIFIYVQKNVACVSRLPVSAAVANFGHQRPYLTTSPVKDSTSGARDLLWRISVGISRSKGYVWSVIPIQICCPKSQVIFTPACRTKRPILPLCGTITELEGRFQASHLLSAPYTAQLTHVERYLVQLWPLVNVISSSMEDGPKIAWFLDHFFSRCQRIKPGWSGAHFHRADVLAAIYSWGSVSTIPSPLGSFGVPERDFKNTYIYIYMYM